MTDNRHAVAYQQEMPDVFKAMVDLQRILDEQGLNRTLHHLVVLRASQINGCGHCVDMHVRDARHDGERETRLDRLVVWEHAGGFSEAERAALRWTEALCTLDARTDYGALRAQLRAYFTDREIGVLTATIGMINFWNRINVSRH